MGDTSNANHPDRAYPFELADPTLLRSDSYVNGEWVSSASGKRFAVEDPGSLHSWTSCPDCVQEDVEPAVQTAYTAFQKYSKFTPRRRAQLLAEWHRLIQSSRDDLAKILVYETGKPLREAYGEIDYGLTFSWWFIGEADRVQGVTASSSIQDRRVVTIKQPIGVAAALVPWNFPVALVMRKASAALAAGCTMVIKPSPETPVTALVLANLATRAGFPPGTLNVLTTSLENTPALSRALCVHPLVKKISFTGSTRVGKIISGLCSENLKKSTLELGGNCPFIIFEDADIDLAVQQLMALKWRHAGQACVTANRVFAHRGIYAKVVQRMVEKTKALVVGHGMDPKTTLGPMTVARSLDKVEELVRDATSKGAKLALGSGRRLDSDGSENYKGYYMAPCILVDMCDDMQMSSEETFGPVLGIYAFDSEEEVTERANNTPYGLASYVFTENIHRVWRMLENLDAGMIGLNAGNSSAAEAPFGGIKDSGWGKESGKDVAVNEFMISKTATLTIKGDY